VPKRPDPLGANATLQYAVVSSTVLAAAYASFAARHQRRISPTASISRTALFVRASGRLGIWALAVGAAANVSYHHAFTALVLAQDVEHPQPPRLYDKTDKHTAEDGCLIGAAAGLMAFVPTLWMRRPTVSWWARMTGLVNLGACTGLVASHVYFQYTGERQKALEELDRQRRRRMLEFHHIFWDKMLMQRFNPLVQAYIRHNAIFRAYHLPAELLDQPDQFVVLPTPTTRASVSADQAAENAAYYVAAPNWSDHLKALDVDTIEAEIEDYERDKIALSKEAEYMAYHLTVKQYEFVHAKHPTQQDKQIRTRELQLLAIVYNRLRAQADEVDRRIVAGRNWLRQKAAMDAAWPRSAWLADHPTVEHVDRHNPTASIAEMEKLQDQFTNEVKIFESKVRSQAYEDVNKRGKWKKDLEDARTMLLATDRIIWELQNMVPKHQGKNEIAPAQVNESANVEQPFKVESNTSVDKSSEELNSEKP
jgi:hypothetical protein